MIQSIPHYLLLSETHILRADDQNATGGDEPRDGIGSWRFVLDSLDGCDHLEVSDEEPNVCGERLELFAVMRGLEALNQPSRVTLVTSSQYVTRGLRNGINVWRECDWKWERFGSMTPIKNYDLWIRVDRALQFHQVECRTFQFGPDSVLVPESSPAVTSPATEEPSSGRWWQRAASMVPKLAGTPAPRWGRPLATPRDVSAGSRIALVS